MADAARPVAVIAEDEPLLASELVDALAQLWPSLRVAECAIDGIEALQAIEEHHPDVAFLDMRMPRLDGLAVARQVAGRCHVVFITAFDAHALAAFEAGAIDYVLKPFTSERLLVTVQRLKTRIGTMPTDLGPLLQRLAAAAPAPQYLQWIQASRGAALRMILVDDICYFRADSKYTLVVTEDSETLIRKSIRELADELDPGMFWQIHRAAIVNVHAIDSVIRTATGGLALRLKHRHETLPVSEAHHHLFRQM